MTTRAVAAGDVGTPAFALVAATADTVTFADNISTVEVISDGLSPVWYTLDGSTPTVGGTNCYYIPATIAIDRRDLVSGATDTVKLISAGSPTLRVQRG
jgi:hypothetical protein